MLLVSPPPASAAAQGDKDVWVAGEIEFAKSIAATFGYVDLAREVLVDARARTLSDKHRESLDLAKCAVLKVGAETEAARSRALAFLGTTDRTRELALETDAVAAYADFLTQFGVSSSAAEARLELAEIARLRGQALVEEIQTLSTTGTFPTPNLERGLEPILAEDPSKARPEGLREKVVAAAEISFATALRAANKVLEDLGAKGTERSEPEEIVYKRAWYTKGLAYHHYGLVYPQGSFERENQLLNCRETLEGFALTVGEGSRAGLMAYLTVGEALASLTSAGPGNDPRRERERLDRVTEAIRYADFVTEFALPADASTLAEIRDLEGDEGIDDRRDIVERAFGQVLALSNREAAIGTLSCPLHTRLYSRALGEEVDLSGPVHRFKEGQESQTHPLVTMGKIAVDRAEALRKWLEKQGRTPRPDGFAALLEAARAFAAEDRADDAMVLAQRVNKENPGTNLQAQARSLMGRIASSPGVRTNPQILLEIARGEFLSQRYDEAIPAFKRLLGALEDEKQRYDFGPTAVYHLAASFEGLDRPYEAAAAYRRGIGEYGGGDEEWASRLAEGMRRAVQTIRRSGNARTDPAIVALGSEADEAVKRHTVGSSRDAVIWRTSKDGIEQGKYAEARAQLLEIPKGSPWYERALVRIAYCLYQEGKIDEALAALDDYLERFVKDPSNAVGDPVKELRRNEAMAEAEYWKGMALRRRAQETEAEPARTEAWRRIAEHFADYETRYPERKEFHDRVFYSRIEALLLSGDLAQAKTVHEKMSKAAPESRFSGAAALEIFKVLDDRVAKARSGLEAAAAGGDAGKAKDALCAALRESAEYLGTSNAVATPAYENWRKESRLWVEIAESCGGEWQKAEETLRAIESRFANDPKAKDDISRFVRLDLARALLAQRRLAEAEPILEALHAIQKTVDTQVLYARCLAGWLDDFGEAFKEVTGTAAETQVQNPPPGTEKFPKFQLATELLDEVLGAYERDKKWSCEWYERKFDQVFAYYRWGLSDGPKTGIAREVVRGLEGLDPTLGAGTCGDRIGRKFRWLKERVR